TASWGGLGIMWNKNVAFVVIRPQRFTKEFVDASSTLSLSFLNPLERQTMLYFGTFSGRNDDKIKRSGLTLTHIDGTPCFEEAEITLICEKLSAQEIDPASFIDPTIDDEQYPKKDYHTMYICEVKKILVKKGTQIAEDCTK
ncbi:MAG: flavin reductase, partial [Oscillospiraceae bacterium]